jgi:hypothetical protein
MDEGWDSLPHACQNFLRENLLIARSELGTILTRASCTALSRSASCSGFWYGMARMA